MGSRTGTASGAVIGGGGGGGLVSTAQQRIRGEVTGAHGHWQVQHTARRRSTTPRESGFKAYVYMITNPWRDGRAASSAAQ
jgi:hypothetical protein